MYMVEFVQTLSDTSFTDVTEKAFFHFNRITFELFVGVII